MKVILTKDVKGLGRAHETITTADGYALNYLIPNRLAVVATSGASKEASVRVTTLGARKELDAALIAQNLSSLAEATITIVAKANEKGHLYDGIGAPELALAAKEQAHIDLPEGAIKLEKPFKELGTFEVPVAYGENFGKFSVSITAA